MSTTAFDSTLFCTAFWVCPRNPCFPFSRNTFLLLLERTIGYLLIRKTQGKEHRLPVVPLISQQFHSGISIDWKQCHLRKTQRSCISNMHLRFTSLDSVKQTFSVNHQRKGQWHWKWQINISVQKSSLKFGVQALLF